MTLTVDIDSVPRWVNGEEVCDACGLGIADEVGIFQRRHGGWRAWHMECREVGTPVAPGRLPADEEADPAIGAFYRVATLQILAGLPTRERQIIVNRWGLFGAPKLTLQQIADRYHITRERVRQLQALAMKRMQQIATEPPAPEAPPARKPVADLWIPTPLPPRARPPVRKPHPVPERGKPNVRARTRPHPRTCRKPAALPIRLPDFLAE